MATVDVDRIETSNKTKNETGGLFSPFGCFKRGRQEWRGARALHREQEVVVEGKNRRCERTRDQKLLLIVQVVFCSNNHLCLLQRSVSLFEIAIPSQLGVIVDYIPLW